MKVLLKADVEGLGNKGTVCDVADGYARNFLIPKGFAIQATRGVVKQAADMARAREAAEAREIAAAEEIASQLSGKSFSIPMKVGDGGKLFGSVGPHDIARAIEEQASVEIDRKQIGLEHPVKELGSLKVPVKLHSTVTAEISVEVISA
ncbi:MAG: 50S ribosomal protein L9 [Acidobacteria bacterium]|nr:MAG: 50S ribosomal protein L9 [Acidobacteriota bacterium]